ncbi:MAG: OmpA family protein [Lysobacterales bacterium]
MATTTHSSIHRSRQQYWQQSDNPQLTWWPWGWLALLALLALFLFGALVIAPNMQKQTTGAVTQQLSAHNMVVMDFSGDGQRVRVAGIADLPDQQLLQNSAGSSRCETWAGSLTCPTLVHLDLSAPAAPERIAETLEPAPAKRRFHDFEAAKTITGIVLIGEVSSDTINQQFERQAQRQFAEVDNQLFISRQPGLASDNQAHARALSVLSHLQRGTARWKQGVFSVSGLVAPELRMNAEMAFKQSSADLTLGDLTLTELKAVDECNQATKDALNRATVKFATASAAIDSASDALLKTLADITKTCPGVLTIEGHTDSVGDESANLILSQSRANAVRQALIELAVDPQRLTAVGLGENQPVGDNQTVDGRAANRRIVMVFAKPPAELP